jgi:hypothetical protein
MDLNLRPFASMKKPPSRPLILCPDDVLAEMAEQRVRVAEIKTKAFELLKASEPDIFLGRQHYPLMVPPDEEE